MYTLKSASEQQGEVIVVFNRFNFRVEGETIDE